MPDGPGALRYRAETEAEAPRDFWTKGTENGGERKKREEGKKKCKDQGREFTPQSARGCQVGHQSGLGFCCKPTNRATRKPSASPPPSPLKTQVSLQGSCDLPRECVSVARICLPASREQGLEPCARVLALLQISHALQPVSLTLRTTLFSMSSPERAFPGPASQPAQHSVQRKWGERCESILKPRKQIGLCWASAASVYPRLSSLGGRWVCLQPSFLSWCCSLPSAGGGRVSRCVWHRPCLSDGQWSLGCAAQLFLPTGRGDLGVVCPAQMKYQM